MYDKEKDKLWIVEINPRISQSHSELFRLVDSVSDMSVPINIALDIDPARPRLKGDFKHATKYYMRVEDNALVKSVPTAKDISKLQEKYSEVSVYLTIEEGQKLSDLKVEDSYTYCIAEIYLGAQSEEELLEKIDTCKSMLPFELEKC